MTTHAEKYIIKFELTGSGDKILYVHSMVVYTYGRAGGHGERFY